MSRVADRLAVVLVTLWVGGMWTIGYLVAPTLFGTLADRAAAGLVAGRLFSLIGWLGLGCGSYVLLLIAVRQQGRSIRNVVFWMVAAMLLLIAVGQFGIQPLMAELKASALPADVMDSPLRDRFATWHGVSSVLYLLQSLLGLGVVLGIRRLLR